MSVASGIQLVSLIVKEYDEAIHFFTEILGFGLVEDSPALTSAGNKPKRWVIVRPPNTDTGSGILLARADGSEQEALVGKQWGGRVGLFLKVEDFQAVYSRLENAGVQFVTVAKDQPYGRVVVFLDLYGNKWDLIGPTPVQVVGNQ